MAVSKDRIEFNFYKYENEDCPSARIQKEASLYAFGLPTHLTVGAAKNGTRILCRPSQFARFIVKRSEIGKRSEANNVNLISGLNSQIVQQPVEKLDVSGEPNQC